MQDIHAALVELMPQASDHAIDGAGHMVPMTHQAECVTLMHFTKINFDAPILGSVPAMMREIFAPWR